jgi:hypothetical protein
MMMKSPNNARRTSFRPQVSIFPFFFVFFYPNKCLLCKQVVNYIMHDMESDGQRQRRQRAQTTPDARRLGHRCVFFFHFLWFLYILTYLLLYIQVTAIETARKVGRMTRARDRCVSSLVSVCSFYVLLLLNVNLLQLATYMKPKKNFNG